MIDGMACMIALQHYIIVGDMRSYADVVRGTAKESSNVTDTVHQLTRQTVVIGKCKQQQ
jgi:hypothetical protein